MPFGFDFAKLPGNGAGPARSRTFAWVVGGMGVIAAVLVILLVTGGGQGPSDEIGDARLIEGDQPRGATDLQIAASMADIATADVRREGADLVFEVVAASPIPQDLERSSLEFRFDVLEGERETWIVSASVNVAVTAAVVSQTTTYGSSTIDGTMPGSVEVAGDTLTIKLQPEGIDGFPESFAWSLSSNLIAFRDLAGSTRVEDQYPDEGSISAP